MKGSPKSLIQSIKNGLEDSGYDYSEKSADIIEQHVKDYLAQKFNVAMLKKELTVWDLWLLIVKK